MTNKRKLHESVIATTVRSNKIKSSSRMNALASRHDDGVDAVDDAENDGGIDGVTISDMFGDDHGGGSRGTKNYSGSGGVKKKTRKTREDASEFVIPSRPSAAAAAAGELIRALLLRSTSVVAERQSLHDIFAQMKRFPFETTSTFGSKTWCGGLVLCGWLGGGGIELSYFMFCMP